MRENFPAEIKNKADEELIAILNETEKYSDDELLATIEELERRNIILDGMKEMKAEILSGEPPKEAREKIPEQLLYMPVIEENFREKITYATDETLITMLDDTDSFSDDELLAVLYELEKRNIEIEGMRQMKWEILGDIMTKNPSVKEKISSLNSTQKNSSRENEKTAIVEDEEILLDDGPDKPAIVALFTPGKGYFVTPLLIITNIAIFILMALTGADILDPTSDELVGWGANYTVRTLGGEWWRLVSSCFIHSGIIHLLMNMYALIYAGIFLESYIGRLRFLTVYLLTGIAGSFTSLWWHDVTVSVGASGAIFGMYGFLIGLLLTKNYFTDEQGTRGMLGQMTLMVVINLAYGLQGNIDNAAHIGGMTFGMILSVAFIPSIRNLDSKKILVRSLVSIFSLSAILFVSFAAALPKTMAMYDVVLEEFSKNEERALEILQTLPATDVSPYESINIRARLKEGMNAWEKNISLLNKLKDVPRKLQPRIKLLKEYSEARKEYFLLFYRYYGNRNSVSQSDVNAADTKVLDKIKKIKALDSASSE